MQSMRFPRYLIDDPLPPVTSDPTAMATEVTTLMCVSVMNGGTVEGTAAVFPPLQRIPLLTSSTAARLGNSWQPEHELIMLP